MTGLSRKKDDDSWPALAPATTRAVPPVRSTPRRIWANRAGMLVATSTSLRQFLATSGSWQAIAAARDGQA